LKKSEVAARVAERDAQRAEEQARQAQAMGQKAEAEAQELARRRSYADERYGNGEARGSLTDRGRAYIRMGPPDEIEDHPGTKEIWKYRNGPTVQFDGSGKLMLTPEEQKAEQARRLGVADRKWSKDGVKGSQTDRGKVYLRLGPPDEIEVHPGQGEAWRYHNGPTYSFDGDGKLKGARPEA